MNELSAGAWRFYCFLARCRNQKTGKCCPSLFLTMEIIGTKKSQAYEFRKELVMAGWATFDGNNVTSLFGFDSPENRTTGSENKEVSSIPEYRTSNAGNKEVTESVPAKQAKVVSDIPESFSDIPESFSDIPETHIRKNQQKNQQREPANTSGAHAPEIASDQPEGQKTQPEGRKPSGKKTTPPKSEFHNHPSVVAYRETLGFYAVNAAQADLIAEATGTEIESAPPEWMKFLRELAQTGNKYAHNVRVMIWAYERYETGASLSEALDVAWSREKGRPISTSNATLASFSPAAQQTIAAGEAWLKRMEKKND